MKKILSAIIILFLFIFNNSFAQDCTAKFEVNAGPDIDVCEGGSVDLHGIIGGDATQAVWRGGKGTFKPDRNSLVTEYTPTAEEAGTAGVVLILVASNPKFPKCPPSRNEIKVIVNTQPKADAGENQHICMGNTIKLNGKITGKAKKTTWISNGTGKFDNVHKLDAVYTPSEKDIKDGACSIKLIAEPFGVCLPDSSTMILMIDKSADFVTEKEKNVKGSGPVKLSITSKDAPGKIEWSSESSGAFSKNNVAETTFTPSDADKTAGKVKVYVTVSDKTNTCSMKKEIVINLGAKK